MAKKNPKTFRVYVDLHFVDYLASFRKSSLWIVSIKKLDICFFSVLFYIFLKLKVSFLSCIFLAKYIIHSIVKHLKVLALTSYTPPLLHHHHKRKIHHHEKENSTGHSTKQNRKITKYYWHKREQRTEYCQKPHFSPFLEYEMYNGFI